MEIGSVDDMLVVVRAISALLALGLAMALFLMAVAPTDDDRHDDGDTPTP
jgi:hypothetical protein